MSETLISNSNISHYRIVSKIGAGGMGDVYLAQDTKLDRRVALKILPQEFAADADRMSRFVREAKSASALNHPNIITIHEIGASGDTHFIATEYIEGETLHTRLRNQSLSLKSALEIAIQVASALDAAHRAGIVHRDIKPENVMIRPDGLVKILDFGIAKLSVRPAVAVGLDLSEPPAAAGGLSVNAEAATAIKTGTSAGMIIGTASYMSPEQARGKVVDARSDIFSFGVVLYEMLAGRKPFAGENAMDFIGSILTDEPMPLSQLLPEVPQQIEQIINKTLRKNREERYQTANDLLLDLKSLQKRLEFEAELERTSPPHKNAEAQTQIIRAETTAKTEARNSIAVLPFANMSNDAENEYFCDGLAEELLNALAKIEDLKVAARTSAFSFKGKDTNVSEIGHALSVKTVLEGSVRKSGSRVRITVQLINAADGYHLWSERYDREMQDIFDVQDEITQAIVDALKLKLFGKEKALVMKRYTDNTEAYELFLKGRYYFSKHAGGGWRKALEYFEQAIEKEPEYAPAYAWISISLTHAWYFGVLSSDEAVPKSKAAANRAREIDSDLAEAHIALGNIHFYNEWDWQKAEQAFKRAIEINSNSADAGMWYGLFLTSRERFDEAINEGRRTVELDPLSLFLNLNVGWIYLFAGRLGDTLAQVRRMIELEPNFNGAYWQMGMVHLLKGRHEEAREEYRKAVALGSYPTTLSILGVACARLGKRDEAFDVLNQLLEMKQQQPVAAFDIARVYGGLDENDKTFEWLEKAIAERNGELVFLNLETKIGTGDMFGKDIRRDPRFQDILRRIGVPTDENSPDKSTNEASDAHTAILSPATPDREMSVPPAVAGGYLAEENPPATAGGTDLNTDAKENPPAITDPNGEHTLQDKPKANRTLLIGVLIGLLLFTGAGLWLFLSRSPNKTPIESIAVMPFVNASGNSDVEYLSDGMTETLINSLSQLPNLNVKARSSVFRYKGKETNSQTIGRELNVQAILNGRVVQRGDQLTLSLELVDVTTENVIWSEQYNRKQTDLVSLQSEIARDVSSKLKTKLSGADEQRVTKTYTANPEAYQLYLKGRFYWNKRAADSLKQAVEFYKRAIEKDPGYALAYSGLADTYVLFPSYSVALPQESFPQAKAAALRALEIDDSLAEAHAALGLYLTIFERNRSGAEKELRRAIELNPNYATAHHWLGLEILAPTKRFDEALVEIRRAEELDPLSSIIVTEVGGCLLLARRYDEAIAQFKHALTLDPKFYFAHVYLGWGFNAKGMYREAIAEYRKALELNDDPTAKAFLALALAKAGQRGEAIKLRDQLKLESPHRYVSSYSFAILHIALGEKDEAFVWLEKDIAERSSWPVLYAVTPELDDLRDDPRFKDMLKRLNLPE